MTTCVLQSGQTGFFHRPSDAATACAGSVSVLRSGCGQLGCSMFGTVAVSGMGRKPQGSKPCAVATCPAFVSVGNFDVDPIYPLSFYGEGVSPTALGLVPPSLSMGDPPVPHHPLGRSLRSLFFFRIA